MNMERKHSPELCSSHFSEVTCFPAVIGANNQPTTLGHGKPSVSERSAEHQSEPNLHQRRGLPSPTRNLAPQKAKSNNNIIAVPPVGQRIGSQQSPPAEAAIATVSLSTQKSAAAEQQQREAKRHSLQSSRGEEGMLVALQQKLFEHYHTVAYTLVILTYFLALCEYFYLRLISLIFPQPIHYKRHCDKHQDEEILRNELHFASGMAIFLVMSFYQLVCFFLLTVSSKYLEVRRTFSHVLSIEQRLHHELVFAVKRTMFSTLYPTFAIYLLCSSVIFCSIFYMVGLRDPIVHVGARIIIHMFDLCVILYFLAFPVLCVLFHPDINCLVRIRCARKARSPRLQTSGGAAKCGDTFSSGGIGKDAAIAPIRRQPTGGGGGGAVHPVDAQAAEAANARQSPAATVEHGGGRTPTASGGTNYGSLERRRIAEETEEKEVATQTELVRQRMRQRRQSRYKRLRDGDESAECQDPDSLETRVRRNQAAGVAGRANEQRNDENEEEREREGGSENSSSSSHGTEEEEEENEDRESAFNKTVRATSTGLRLELRDPDGFGPVSC